MSFKLVSVFQMGLCRRLQNIRNNQSKLLICRNISLTKLNAQYQYDKSKSGNTSADSKKPKNSPKITLFGPNNSMSVTSLEEALKLSKRRDLKLVKVQEEDNKNQRPVYKLMTAADLLAEEAAGSNSNYQSVEDIKESNTKKGEKSLTIGSRIADHDLSSRIKNIVKWLQKRHEVRILIQGSPGDPQSSEKIFEKIDLAVNNPEVAGKIVQRRHKSGNTKFNIIPGDEKNSNPL